MMLGRYILEKRGIRSDAIWTSELTYQSFLARIPLLFDTLALLSSQYWPREKLERLQDARMEDSLRAAHSIAYWRGVLSETNRRENEPLREYVSRLPVTRKRDLSENEIENIADVSLLPVSETDHTSGSTGKPFHFFQDRGAILRSWAVTERTFRIGSRTRPPLVYMRARPRHGFTFYRHIWFYLRGYNSIRHRMDAFAELGEKLKKGFLLYGYTSWVAELAKQMEATGLKLPIRRVWVAGEHLMGPDREVIERVMGAELLQLYASREVGFLGFECEHHRMHINEEWAYLEIVDESGRRLPDGEEGRIVVTTFDNRVMPYVRYEIGDVGSISPDMCPCGRTLKTLVFKGRTTELIELSDNRVVSLLDVAYSLGSYRDSIRQYQIIQKAADSFVFRVVTGPTFAAQKANITALMIRMLHPDVRITWEEVEVIPEATSGKAVYFIRDISQGS